jgi:hypothetical protein
MAYQSRLAFAEAIKARSYPPRIAARTKHVEALREEIGCSLICRLALRYNPFSVH